MIFLLWFFIIVLGYIAVIKETWFDLFMRFILQRNFFYKGIFQN